jgi:hypothetical protein
MEARFYIICHIKTPTGPEAYGRFEIGNDREQAKELFATLKGDKEVNEQNMLWIELMETTNGLPINITILSCTLDQITENFRIITKEVFTNHNLGKRL